MWGDSTATMVRYAHPDSNFFPACNISHSVHDIDRDGFNDVIAAINNLFPDEDSICLEHIRENLDAPTSFIWNGTDNMGNTLPSGVYVAKVQISNECFITKIILMR